MRFFFKVLHNELWEHLEDLYDSVRQYLLKDQRRMLQNYGVYLGTEDNVLELDSGDSRTTLLLHEKLLNHEKSLNASFYGI